MQVGFKYSLNTNYYGSPAFNGRLEKVIAAIKNSKFKEANVTLDEAIKIYNKFGYTVRAKAGSHMTITAPDGFEFALQIPHGNEKRFIHPNDVKKLKFVINNDRDSLINTIKI